MTYSKVRQGFIYLLRNPIHIDWVKIGRTTNINFVLNAANRFGPYPFDLLCGFVVDDMERAETVIHKALHQYRAPARYVNSTAMPEWFNVPTILEHFPTSPVGHTEVTDHLQHLRDYLERLLDNSSIGHEPLDPDQMSTRSTPVPPEVLALLEKWN